MLSFIRQRPAGCVVPIILLLGTPVLRAQEPVVQGDLGRRVDSLATAAAANGFHGSILVAQRGDVALLKGYGLANEAARTPYGPGTLVQIGSNVKDFTKVAIYQLVEAGRLRLADSLGRFVENLAADKQGITIQQLLDHTAGLPLGAGGGDTYPLTRAELISRLNALTLLSAPGATERYSNMGYALLAVVIERLSGQGYDRYVAEHVLAPAGLGETGSYLPNFDPARIAHGYRDGRDIGVILDMPHDADGHLYALRGNGGYLSTLSDMRRFYAALSGPVLLREEAHRRAVFRADEPVVLAGSDLTSFFLFASYPGRDAQVIVASNHNGYPGNRLLRQIEPLLGPAPGGGEMAVVTTGPGPGRAGGPSTGPATDRLPDHGAGRTIGAWLEAYNSGDTARVRRFYMEFGANGPGATPIETRLERYRSMFEDLGRLTLRDAQPLADGTGWVVHLATEHGPALTMTFLLEPDSNKLRGMRAEVG